jgi:ribonucleoside-diphosphate reductase alpha chain
VISVALRFTAHLTPEERVKEIIGQLQGIGGTRPMGFGKDRILSLPDAIAKVLTMHFVKYKAAQKLAASNGNGNGNGDAKILLAKAEGNGSAKGALVSQVTQPSLMPATATAPAHFDICPDCGNTTLANEEGCSKCYSCGYAAC